MAREIPEGRDWGTPPAIVLDVHDGDTITVDADRGLETRRNPIKLRLNQTSAPELRVRREGRMIENPAGRAARDRVMQLCPPGTEILIRTFRTKGDVERETLTRYVADVFYPKPDGTYGCLNDELIAGGFAREGAFEG